MLILSIIYRYQDKLLQEKKSVVYFFYYAFLIGHRTKGLSVGTLYYTI